MRHLAEERSKEPEGGGWEGTRNKQGKGDHEEKNLVMTKTSFLEGVKVRMERARAEIN
jgi:hypothetical protein